MKIKRLTIAFFAFMLRGSVFLGKRKTIAFYFYYKGEERNETIKIIYSGNLFDCDYDSDYSSNGTNIYTIANDGSYDDADICSNTCGYYTGG